MVQNSLLIIIFCNSVVAEYWHKTFNSPLLTLQSLESFTLILITMPLTCKMHPFLSIWYSYVRLRRLRTFYQFEAFENNPKSLISQHRERSELRTLYEFSTSEFLFLAQKFKLIEKLEKNCEIVQSKKTFLCACTLYSCWRARFARCSIYNSNHSFWTNLTRRDEQIDALKV